MSILDPQSRLKEVRRVLLITLGLNFLVAGAKLGYGFFTETLSMVADGFHSVLDASSNVVGLIALGFAARPADHHHPYGHRKIEALAAIFISGTLFYACYEILTHAHQRLYHHTQPQVTLYSFLIMLGTMAINYWVSQYEHRKGEELRSQILTADSAHTRSDIYASFSVLIALVGVYFNWPYLDIIAAGLIALIVGYSGYQIVLESLGTLLDTSVLDPRQVLDVVHAVPGVQSAHDVRTRGHATAIYMDLNIHVDSQLSTQEAHDLTHQVIYKIKQSIPGVVDVVVHTEPSTPHHE